MISRVSGKWTMYFSSLHGHADVLLGAPTECRHGTKAPSSPRQSRAGLPMRVMIRIETATYGESVSWIPISAIGEPSGPMLNGTTYIVRPRIAPLNLSRRTPRMSSGSRQLLVGPASDSLREQMNVRSSTRATSPGSLRARYEFGRFASESFSNVPASTSSAHSASYSSAEPSHQWMAAGLVSSATSSTQERSLRCLVGTVVSSVTWARASLGLSGLYKLGRNGESNRRARAATRQ